MKNTDQFDSELFEKEFESDRPKIIDYVGIIRASLIPIILIFAISMIVTFIYLKNYPINYRATTVVRVEKPRNGILESQSLSFNLSVTEASDRYLSNQIEILKGYYIRDIVARTILDSLKASPSYSSFYYVVDKVSETEKRLTSQESLRRRLFDLVRIDIKKGVDALTISVEGLSFHEIQMIVNIYANVFVEYSKEINKEDLINVKKFLEIEKEKKYSDLNNSETALEYFQKESGFVTLDDQSKLLIDAISKYDAMKNESSIELKTIENELSGLKRESEKIDKKLYDYVSGQIAQPYITELQRQIAELEVKRDIEITTATEPKVRDKIINDTRLKLEKLSKTLTEKTEILRAGLVAETPQEVRSIAESIMQNNLKSNALKTRIRSVTEVLGRYEIEFNKLPSQSIEFAKLERVRKSNEKLYLALEEKYQEATINERSRLGYASLLDPGIDSVGPVSPNKSLIMLTGVIIGLALGIIFAFTRNYLDKSIKSPEQLENQGASVLSWIPSFKELVEEHSPETDFIVELKPSSSVSEAFKALRTRIQYSKIAEKPLKVILVTSTIPSEGKTIVSTNLAGSFAQAGNRTLLLDCDLRKPRVHNVMQSDRYPGLSDKLFKNVTMDEIIRPTKLANMSYITSGTIPPNPSELLGSQQMIEFIDEIRELFDIVIIDSPPFVSVTDSEILFNVTDGTILVSRANLTPLETFIKTYKRLYKINSRNLLGCVLNDFAFKSSYGYYYNYYYYYSKPDAKKTVKK